MSYQIEYNQAVRQLRANEEFQKLKPFRQAQLIARYWRKHKRVVQKGATSLGKFAPSQGTELHQIARKAKNGRKGFRGSV